MASFLKDDGPITWECSVDDDGYRDYIATFRVLCERGDGPYTILLTPGLPLPGAPWAIDNDYDPWSWCRMGRRITAARGIPEGDPTTVWDVTCFWSNRPGKRCQDTQIEDPLLEPQKLSGSFLKYTEEATRDAEDIPIKNSAHEQIRGPQVEFDKNRPTVRVVQNVPDLQFDLLASLMDCVNDDVLWGLPRRCWKLSGVSWEQKWHGTCEIYYTRTLEFDASTRTDPETDELVSGFDRDLLDEGSKALNGRWGRTAAEGYGWILVPLDSAGTIEPDPENPAHFTRFKDRNGENTRVLLKNGIPVDTTDSAGTGDTTINDEPGVIHVEKYQEANMLLLGIPVNLEQ